MSGAEGCQLKELCLQDKQKVAKLIKQVVSLKQQQETSSSESQQRIVELEKRNRQLEVRNKEIIKENANSKSKLMQALVMIKSYQQQVKVLENLKHIQRSESTKQNREDDTSMLPCTTENCAHPLTDVSEEEDNLHQRRDQECQTEEVSFGMQVIEKEPPVVESDLGTEMTSGVEEETCQSVTKTAVGCDDASHSMCTAAQEPDKKSTEMRWIFDPNRSPGGRFVKIQEPSSRDQHLAKSPSDPQITPHDWTSEHCSNTQLPPTPKDHTSLLEMPFHASLLDLVAEVEELSHQSPCADWLSATSQSSSSSDFHEDECDHIHRILENALP